MKKILNPRITESSTLGQEKNEDSLEPDIKILSLIIDEGSNQP